MSRRPSIGLLGKDQDNLWSPNIEHFGYLAILVGTLLEGETFLILGGFAAHRGYLDLSLVILSAFLGTVLGDQLFYSWVANTVKRC